MNGKDIRLSYTNLQGILDGKQTIRYESISDILISMFSGINKCLQGHNIFMIDFGSSRYQQFVISLICISAEFPAYTGWLEAKALWKASLKAIAEMIFEVMSRFRCFLKITVNNGMEFKGAVTLLADKYNILQSVRERYC